MRHPRESGRALRRLLATGLGALVVSAPGLACGSGSDDETGRSSQPSAGAESAASARRGAIATGDFFFRPAERTAKVGERITWLNLGEVPHTVTGPGFNSPSFEGGQDYSFTFKRRGTYEYICALHPTRMSGTVVVR